MEKKDNLLQPPASSSLLRSTGEASLSSSSSSSYSSSASPPDFLRQLHAVFKQRRPLGTMRARATRLVDPQKGQKNTSQAAPSLTGSSGGKVARKTLVPVGDKRLTNEVAADMTGNPPNESFSLNPPSLTSTLTSVCEENRKPNHFGLQKRDASMTSDRKRITLVTFPSTLELETPVVPVSDGLKKVLLSSGSTSNVNFQSACTLMTNDTRMDEITSYLHSLALTEDDGNLGKGVNVNEQDLNQQGAQNMDISSSGMILAENLEKRKERSLNQQCLESGTQSTVMCSSCITTISVHSGPASQFTHASLPGQAAFPSQVGQGAVMIEGSSMKDNKEGHHNSDDVMKSGVLDNAGCLKSQVPPMINSSSSVDMKPPQSSKAEKVTRTKKYDPNVFFRVNGKLYQKLGKIGSGGSSEVHKVISADCTIYALKKIKLKGRDYPTAHGFCQEIEYLRKLKGKSNIIQLIDYEVTDKTLLQEAMEASMTSKDGRIKNDQYIYMVLEYGEIDLAHMLSQKWKDMDRLSWNIDENWLRFYWQQMLEAVSTIHEERIVHSDLKPANFLLVRGSLKLIDFGIAKAIMSDTTNIQRDAQVGTLNYMSPESFMWSEQDQSGGTIKCGRPSDIWSLGCILYQMVYGKTPFVDYKSFWAKFKAITDINHEINYEHVANPWLVDLMKRCLERDRSKRWRIPQLLQHPFLVPPVPRELASDTWDDVPCQLLFQRVGLYWNEPEVSSLCAQLHSVVSRIEKEREIGSMNQ